MRSLKTIQSRFTYTLTALLLSCVAMESVQAQSPKVLGKVSSSQITEISGIVPYGYKEGYFWVHNDSGDKSAIYLIDSTANLKVSIEVLGAKFIDIEEIGRCNIDGHPYLIIADTGNNLRKREVLSLYIIAEPKLDLSLPTSTATATIWKEIKFNYRDKPRDAEAFFVDPIDQHIYIFSKRDFKSDIFRLPLQHTTDEKFSLSPIGQLPFTFTTAADISSDGKHILIKNISNIFYWERTTGESILQALSKKYKKIPYKLEPQGEALCFDLNKRYFYTISERPLGLDAYLYQYEY